MDQYVPLLPLPRFHPHVFSLVPTPFSSHAFHAVDGYLQSVPYHIFIFLFPLHRHVYLGLFVFVNFWTILVRQYFGVVCWRTDSSHSPSPQIHDSDMITGHPLETVINGPAHHTLHHIYFTVNYGQVGLNRCHMLSRHMLTELPFLCSISHGQINLGGLTDSLNLTSTLCLKSKALIKLHWESNYNSQACTTRLFIHWYWLGEYLMARSLVNKKMRLA